MLKNTLNYITFNEQFQTLIFYKNFSYKLSKSLNSLNYNYLQMQKTSSNSCFNKNNIFKTSSILKRVQQSNKLTNSVRSSVNERDDFNQFIVSDLPNMIHFIERSQNKIKYTPKVIIHRQQNSTFKISVQCPKRLLIQYLSYFDEIIKVQIVQQIVDTLFILSERYGYFYCDRFMFRMSQDRRPVVWINQNFKFNEPEFPIQINSVAEGKFINKIIKTFSQIIQFNKTTEIVTKQQLRQIFKQMVQRLKSLEKRKQLIIKTKRSVNKKQTKLIQQRATSPKIRIRAPQTLIQTTPRHKTTQFSQRILYSEKKSKSKNSLKGNKQSNNLKSIKGQVNEQRIINKNFIVSNDLNENKILKTNKSNDLYKRTAQEIMTNKVNPRGLNPQNNSSNISQSPLGKNINNFKQDEDTVCSDMKEDRQKLKNKLNLKNIEKKIRKKSQDIQMLQSWIKDDKINSNQQQKYENLTFSTGLTISSLKSQLSSIMDHKVDDERIVKRGHLQSQKQTQPHNQHKGPKQQEEIITITEVEIEKQMDNLFDSISQKEQNDISPALKGVRQSKLFKQLQILFVSTDNFNQQKQIKSEQLTQLTNQFSSILG